jgi:hypothetical protein
MVFAVNALFSDILDVFVPNGRTRVHVKYAKRVVNKFTRV